MKKLFFILLAFGLFGCGAASLEDTIADVCEDINEYECQILSAEDCAETKATLCSGN